jgi:two-component system chemotaxis response regulator CheB
VGASAGGVEALQELVSTLPSDLRAAVFVVLHVAPRSRSHLPEILSRSGKLPAVHATEGMRIEQGRIYVAPPDHHLVVERDHVHLSLGPKENHQRPCINVTFRSAAVAHDGRVVGVVLSGQLDDGTAGLWDVKRQGGTAVVQNPEDAMFPSMPLSALREVEVDHTVRLAEMGPLLVRLTHEEKRTAGPNGSKAMEPTLSDVTCPDCRGTIWEVPKGSFKEFRCRVGHTFSSRSMLIEHFVAEEKALWQAIVALEEGAALAHRLCDELEPDMRTRLIEEARRGAAQANTLRQLLEQRATFSLDHV